MTVMDVARRTLRRSIAYKVARSTQLQMRGLQDPARPLPSFVIIGAHKAGTTSFYKNLTTHPQILPAWTKEVHYFDRNPLPPLSWYRSHFPSRRELSEVDGISGEASPSYCLLPHVPKLVRQHMPDCKLILLLRDPVARAYSAHQYNSRGGMMDLSFEDWIERDFRLVGDADISASRYASLLSNSNPAEKLPLALLRGIYVEQIKLWHAAFPKEQLLILDSAAYFGDAPGTLRNVARDFLGLRDHDFGYRKTRTEARSYPKIPGKAADRLRAFYAPFNARLYDYLGRDFGW